MKKSSNYPAKKKNLLFACSACKDHVLSEHSSNTELCCSVDNIPHPGMS